MHTLNALRETQLEHGQTLAEHSEVLAGHTQVLAEYSEVLAGHSQAHRKTLAGIEQILTLLEQQRAITKLARSTTASREGHSAGPGA